MKFSIDCDQKYNNNISIWYCNSGIINTTIGNDQGLSNSSNVPYNLHGIIWSSRTGAQEMTGFIPPPKN